MELGLGLQDCRVHGRLLHRDFARYFGIGSSVACFHYNFIAPNSVLMPAQQISYDRGSQQQWLILEVGELIEVSQLPFAAAWKGVMQDLGKKLLGMCMIGQIIL